MGVLRWGAVGGAVGAGPQLGAHQGRMDSAADGIRRAGGCAASRVGGCGGLREGVWAIRRRPVRSLCAGEGCRAVACCLPDLRAQLCHERSVTRRQLTCQHRASGYFRENQEDRGRRVRGRGRCCGWVGKRAGGSRYAKGGQVGRWNSLTALCQVHQFVQVVLGAASAPISRELSATCPLANCRFRNAGGQCGEFGRYGPSFRRPAHARCPVRRASSSHCRGGSAWPAAQPTP